MDRPKVPWLAAPEALATGVQKTLISFDQTGTAERQVLRGAGRQMPALNQEERSDFFGEHHTFQSS